MLDSQCNELARPIARTKLGQELGAFTRASTCRARRSTSRAALLASAHQRIRRGWGEALRGDGWCVRRTSSRRPFPTCGDPQRGRRPWRDESPGYQGVARGSRRRQGVDTSSVAFRRVERLPRTVPEVGVRSLRDGLSAATCRAASPGNRYVGTSIVHPDMRAVSGFRSAPEAMSSRSVLSRSQGVLAMTTNKLASNAHKDGKSHNHEVDCQPGNAFIDDKGSILGEISVQPGGCFTVSDGLGESDRGSTVAIYIISHDGHNVTKDVIGDPGKLNCQLQVKPDAKHGRYYVTTTDPTTHLRSSKVVGDPANGKLRIGSTVEHDHRATERDHRVIVTDCANVTIRPGSTVE